MGSLLDRYQAVLLDMNGTFMFGGDRFGPDADFHASYRASGGTRLTAEAVHRAVSDCYGRLDALYLDPARTESFPQVREVLAEFTACAGLPAAEVELLEDVFAPHEIGRVPDVYAAALRRLAATHRMGVVSNLWSRKPHWLAEFCRSGVLSLFETVVFSSDGPSMKPSPALFRQALAALPVPQSSVLFVGDSLRCDIGGATAVGLGSVWVNAGGTARPADSPTPTFEVRSLLDLAGAHDGA
jgi:putative hydrolase of the HAD superfamily/5'-nucleotidase